MQLIASELCTQLSSTYTLMFGLILNYFISGAVFTFMIIQVTLIDGDDQLILMGVVIKATLTDVLDGLTLPSMTCETPLTGVLDRAWQLVFCKQCLPSIGFRAVSHARPSLVLASF